MSVHGTGMFEQFVTLAILCLIVVGCVNGVKRTSRRKEMEHIERMKSLEMGLIPQPSGLDWPAATVCIAIGAGVPIGSFLVAWLASLTADVPHAIWVAPVFVSLVALGSSRKLANRIIDPKKARVLRERSESPVGKHEFDPDAYDVVGSRGA